MRINIFRFFPIKTPKMSKALKFLKNTFQLSEAITPEQKVTAMHYIEYLRNRVRPNSYYYKVLVSYAKQYIALQDTINHDFDRLISSIADKTLIDQYSEKLLQYYLNQQDFSGLLRCDFFQDCFVVFSRYVQNNPMLKTKLLKNLPGDKDVLQKEGDLKVYYQPSYVELVRCLCNSDIESIYEKLDQFVLRKLREMMEEGELKKQRLVEFIVWLKQDYQQVFPRTEQGFLGLRKLFLQDTMPWQMSVHQLLGELAPAIQQDYQLKELDIIFSDYTFAREKITEFKVSCVTDYIEDSIYCDKSVVEMKLIRDKYGKRNFNKIINKVENFLSDRFSRQPSCISNQPAIKYARKLIKAIGASTKLLSSLELERFQKRFNEVSSEVDPKLLTEELWLLFYEGQYKKLVEQLEDLAFTIKHYQTNLGVYVAIRRIAIEEALTKIMENFITRRYDEISYEELCSIKKELVDPLSNEFFSQFKDQFSVLHKNYYRWCGIKCEQYFVADLAASQLTSTPYYLPSSISTDFIDYCRLRPKQTRAIIVRLDMMLASVSQNLMRDLLAAFRYSIGQPFAAKINPLLQEYPLFKKIVNHCFQSLKLKTSRIVLEEADVYAIKKSIFYKERYQGFWCRLINDLLTHIPKQKVTCWLVQAMGNVKQKARLISSTCTFFGRANNVSHSRMDIASKRIERLSSRVSQFEDNFNAQLVQFEGVNI